MKTPRTTRARPDVGAPVEGATPSTPLRRSGRKRPAAEDLMALIDTASADVIAARAHQLFLSRGGVHGHDLDDWLEAERQVRRVPGREH